MGYNYISDSRVTVGVDGMMELDAAKVLYNLTCIYTVKCAARVGCRNLHSVHSIQLNSV